MSLLRKFRALFRKETLDAEMSEEMRAHLEMQAAENVKRGMSLIEARYAARRSFGGVEQIKERARDQRAVGWFENAARDLRFAFRQLAANPGFTFLAVVTLGLGIGANTSMFSVLNGILLKPLPYPDHEQLDRIYRGTPQNPDGNISPADWLEFQRAKGGYGEAAAYTPANVSLSEPGHPADMAYAVRSTTNLFALLGVGPQLGRDFRPGEDAPGRDRVVILSQRTWLNRFGGKPDVIGRTIRIDGEPHEIVGVMPAAFNDWRHLGVIDLFRPLALSGEQAADRGSPIMRIMFRHAAAHPRSETDGFIANFGRRLAVDFPAANAESSWRAVPLQITAAGGGATSIMPMLIGLSGFVLLIACSNLANLLLARTMARAREFAVRAALGASRTQLLRPLLAESLLLALAGGGLAIVVALWAHDWFAVRSTGDNGERVVFTLDWLVVGWALAASLVTAVAFGLAPALFALRIDLNDTLKSGGRGSTGGRGHQRFRHVLIVGQFALAMILLTGAGLFIRGLHDLNNRRSGWESTRLVTGTALLPIAGYPDADKVNAFHRLALERLAAVPGVAAVSISSFTPFFNWPESRKFFVEGRERPAPGHEPAAAINCVSPQYFETFGTRLVAGRVFTGRDTATATKVFIISQTTAKALFGGENPIGRRLAQAGGDDLHWGEIVGVVNDVQSVIPDRNPVTYQVYEPMAQEPRWQNEITVRTAAGVAASVVVDRIRATMAELDPDLPVRKLQPVDTTITRENYQLAVLRDILTAIALLGLGLASLGIYGIIARTMAQRTGEFAIRLALGASLENLVRLVLVSGVKLALVGSAIGLLGAFGVAQILALNFPGMRTDGTLVLVITTLLLVGVALVACWLPARRATKVDPMSVLRCE